MSLIGDWVEASEAQGTEGGSLRWRPKVPPQRPLESAACNGNGARWSNCDYDLKECCTTHPAEMFGVEPGEESGAWSKAALQGLDAAKHDFRRWESQALIGEGPRHPNLQARSHRVLGVKS